MKTALWSLAILVVCALTAMLARPRTEPVYNGRTLDAWVALTAYVPLVDFSMCGDSGYPVRREAFDALVAIGAPAVPALSAMVSDRKAVWHRRTAAVEALGRIGPPAIDAADCLAEALNDPTFPHQQAYDVPHSIRKIGAAAKCVPALTAHLRAIDPTLPLKMLDASFTVNALGDAGPAARPALSTIIDLVRRARGEELFPARRDGIDALAHIDPRAPEARALFTECLADPNPQVRAAAARALGASR